MKIQIGKNTDEPGNRFFVKPYDRDGFCIGDVETDYLLYWYINEVLHIPHEFGYWELELDD